jgi:hypothetical protein
MSTDIDSDDTVRGTVLNLVETAGLVVSRLFVAGFVAGYFALWLALAGFHYSTGDLRQSAVTVAVFVLPMVGLLLWRGARAFDVGAAEFDVDLTPTSS